MKLNCTLLTNTQKERGGRRGRGRRCEENREVTLSFASSLSLEHAPTLPPTPSSHLPLPSSSYIMHFPSFLGVSTLHTELLIHFPWPVHCITPPSPQSRLETNIPFLVAFFHPSPHFLSGYLNSLVLNIPWTILVNFIIYSIL